MTVVIPALDCATALPASVGAIGAALDERDEIVIADAGSSDATVLVATRLAREIERIRFVRCEPAAGLSGAVREGLAAGSCTQALVLDARVRLPQGWLDHASSVLLEYPEAGAFLLPGANACVLGGRGVLLAIAARCPDALATGNASRLGEALRSAGAPLLVAPGPPRSEIRVPPDARRRVAGAVARFGKALREGQLVEAGDAGGGRDPLHEDARADAPREGEALRAILELSRTMRAPGALLDVGAGTGAHMATLGDLAEALEVVAFEPDPGAWRALERNLCAWPRARVERIALADVTASLSIPARPGQAEPSLADALRLTEVPGLRLDDLHHLPAPSVIRIGCAGSAAQVLRGAGATLAAHQPLVLTRSPAGTGPAELQSVAAGAGYAALPLEAPGWASLVLVPRGELPRLAQVIPELLAARGTS